MARSSHTAETAGGMAAICGMVVGVASFIAALLALITDNVVGGGVCLGASALAFGLVANACWRD